MISLDAEAHFVRAVRGIRTDRDYDGAIDVLVAAERRHGIRILREDVMGSLAVSWAAVDPSSPPTLRQLRELMARPPRSDRDWAIFHQARHALYRDATDDELPSARLFPFLTETSLLLGGTDFANDHWIEDRGGVLASFTQRAWGRLLGEWAIERGWRQTNDHALFAFHLDTEIPDYEHWVATVLEVIRRKCERQLDDRWTDRPDNLAGRSGG